jgi:hypothetical protein
MSVQFSTLTSSWTFTCIFGCYEWDFEGEDEARRAFLFHRCSGNIPVGDVGSEPCS